MPSELLIEPGDQEVLPESIGLLPSICLTRRDAGFFQPDTCREILLEHFQTANLAGFGCEDMPAAICAAGCLLNYIKETQRTALPHLQGIQVEQAGEFLHLDAISRRNLEIESSMSGERRHTLVGIMDASVTAMGGRLLRRWIGSPLRSRTRLAARHKAVGALLAGHGFEPFREVLRGVGDVERILSRVALRSARPRDLRP